MDFGAAVGFDGSLGPDPEAERKRYGSGFFKQLGRPPSEDAAERGLINGSSGNKGSAKVAKSSDDCFSVSAPRAVAAAVLLPQTSSSNSLFSDAQQRLSSGGVNGGNMPGMVLRGGRGPFTPSQWMELEHQALIYKCINANIPVPSNLLIPVRKALESIGICYASGLLRSNSLGWGTFQLGFSNRTDPEPGRCRRTDGKKWRCSRDAVADQKYCEHHMNRGRHRSRKPVEGLHSGHPVSGGPTTTTTATATFAATTTFSAAASKGLPVRSVVPGCGASENSFNRFQSALSVSADSSLNRLFMNKEDASEKIQKPSSGFSLTSPSMDLKSTTTPFLTDDSSHRSSSLLTSCQILGTPKDLAHPKAEPNHLICQFKNDWSYGMKVQSPDVTHLSISTPMASNHNKVNLSPLRSTYELYQPQMNLGIGGGMVYDEKVQTHTVNSIPVSWETSLGGPLGEVLHSASNSCSSTDSKNSSVLTLMTEGWESNFSSALGLSPIGVLQKNAFSSVSNSSAGSSPRAEENRSKLLEEAARLGEL